MEEQMRKERAEATRTSKHQLQSIMSEFWRLRTNTKKTLKKERSRKKPY